MRDSKFMLFIAVFLIVAAVTTVQAQAQTSTTKTATAATTKLASMDRTFIAKAAMGGMAEVELGQLAKDKAESQDVKDFASRMVEDHGKANDELKGLADQKNVKFPTTIDKAHRSAKSMLEKTTGAAFDKAYMRDMVKDHTKDVAEFKKAVDHAKDPDLKSWIEKTLPTLEEHLKQAKEVAEKVGAITATAAKKTGS
jgi:putative membrane protein